MGMDQEGPLKGFNAKDWGFISVTPAFDRKKGFADQTAEHRYCKVEERETAFSNDKWKSIWVNDDAGAQPVVVVRTFHNPSLAVTAVIYSRIHNRSSTNLLFD